MSYASRILLFLGDVMSSSDRRDAGCYTPRAVEGIACNVCEDYKAAL